MNHLITAQFELTTPTESFAEGMTEAQETARQMLVAMSRDYGFPIKLVRVDPLPKVEGIKMEGNNG